MTPMADTFEMLIAEHQEIERMFADLEAATPRTRRALLGEFADKVCAHLVCEEALVYPSMVGTTSPETMAEILAEHEAIQGALADLLWIAHPEDVLQAKLALLASLIQGHARWQEDALFVTVTDRVAA